MANGITLDGITYSGLGIVDIRRIADVVEDNTGVTLMSGRRKRGIVGTYLSYKMTIERLSSDPTDYDSFYTQITAPMECHYIYVPYGNGVTIIEAMVEKVEDSILLKNDRGTRWGGLTVTFKSLKPYRV